MPDLPPVFARGPHGVLRAVTPLYLPPYAPVADARLEPDGPDVRLVIETECDAVSQMHSILFSSVRAFRWKAELYTDGFDALHSGILFEILDSSWVADLKHFAAEDMASFWVMRHYFASVPDAGVFEIVAANAVPSAPDP